MLGKRREECGVLTVILELELRRVRKENTLLVSNLKEYKEQVKSLKKNANDEYSDGVASLKSRSDQIKRWNRYTGEQATTTDQR